MLFKCYGHDHNRGVGTLSSSISFLHFRSKVHFFDLKVVIDKIFYFLQEKVNERDYLEEDFFKELIKMYTKIIERLRE